MNQYQMIKAEIFRQIQMRALVSLALSGLWALSGATPQIIHLLALYGIVTLLDTFYGLFTLRMAHQPLIKGTSVNVPPAPATNKVPLGFCPDTPAPSSADAVRQQNIQ